MKKKIDFAAFDLDFKALEERQYKLRCDAYAKLRELFKAAGITELEIPIDEEDEDLPALWTDDDEMVKRIIMFDNEFNYVTEKGTVYSDFAVSPVDAGSVALQILGE